MNGVGGADQDLSPVAPESHGGDPRRRWCVSGKYLACFLFTVLVGVTCAPISVLPHELSLSHRTASRHAVLMYHFGEFVESMTEDTVPELDLWRYPDGGYAQLIAIPSYAAGKLLSRWFSPRLAFNLVFMANLLASALAFYLLGRVVRLGIWGACGLGILVAFHPCLQSFIMRGQIENTMLWPVGLALVAGASILTSKRAPVVWSFLHCVTPLLVLFCTPFYAIFFFALSPIAFLFFKYRFAVGWRDRRILWYAASLLLGLLLVRSGVEFYRPIPDQGTGKSYIFRGTHQIGLGAVTPTESLADLVRPSGVLTGEKPYVGLALGLGVLAAIGGLVATRRWRKEFFIPLAGMGFFLVLAMGRSLGGAEQSANAGFPLLATFIDRIYPDFERLVKLFRALPFAAICGGLVTALAIDLLRARWAAAALSSLVILSCIDSVLVAPIAVRSHGRYWYDSRLDMDSVIAMAPKFSEAELPIVDFPPPSRKQMKRWLHYYYYQTEHCQRMIWAEGMPDHLQGFMGRLRHVYDNAEAYAASPGQRDSIRAEIDAAGVGMIALHLHLTPEERAAVVADLLDSWYPRIEESDRTILWRVR